MAGGESNASAVCRRAAAAAANPASMVAPYSSHMVDNFLAIDDTVPHQTTQCSFIGQKSESNLIKTIFLDKNHGYRSKMSLPLDFGWMGTGLARRLLDLYFLVF